MSKPYPDVPQKPDVPGIEHRILDGWEAADTFEHSVEGRPTEDSFTFFDGPPFANGLPHHGHLLTGYVKDVIPRFQTMRGKRVERRFGWDCHGLPAEMEAEKELGLSGRQAIETHGIAEFNDYCRTSVMRYTNEWQKTVNRQARWVDFEHDYKTMDLSYMESVMWAFKQLHDKGLVYEAYRVMPYSWGAETPLSNFEIRLDDATRPRQDPAVTIAFTLDPADDDPGPLDIVAWTTTPWTLPSNLALAVGPEVDYAVVEVDGRYMVIGDAARDRYANELDHSEPITTLKGSDLVGRTYQPLLPYFADRTDAFRVLGGDFIDTSDGTGVVHMAPGFGEDDQAVCEANGIPIGRVLPVDDQGRFTDDVPDWAGQNVFEANPDILRHLKELGRVVRHDTYEHNYPHCWRTDTPIIYKAISSWYVEVTAIRDRLMELNQQINWVPENVRDGRFGQWLEGARDWSISRNRFWGSPIPIWVSDNPDFPRTDVYGSLDEIEADFNVRPTDLHRPFIDELTRPNPDDPSGQSTMRRVPEVLDCWFESGSMPFAQVHYPFENRELFEANFPADFIVEYINQTRGWFYTLHVLAGALFDKPAFQNVICHGILLAEDGAKLSKKLRNYTEPNEIFDKQGADALRWYFMASNIVRGGDARISDQAIDDVTRQVLLPIWNAYYFFTLYANADGVAGQFRADSQQLLDRYILAKTRELVEGVTDELEAYDLAAATTHVSAFIDALNNWYIRRSRERFWGGGGGVGDADARDTLYTVLVTLMKVTAPLLPMLTEEIHRGLTSADSVHLEDWPDPTVFPADHDLVADMDRLREVASVALRLREDNGLRTRLPLNTLTVAGRDTDRLLAFSDLLADEVNVKKVEASDDLEAYGSFVLRPDGKALGPRLGGSVQEVFKGAKTGDWSQDGDTATVAGHRLERGEYELALQPKTEGASAALRTNDVIVNLDTEVTDDLRTEGAARDLIRHVQSARRDADLAVTDRITLVVAADDGLGLASHAAQIADAVLATDLQFGPVANGHSVKIDGATVEFTLSPV
ncbi:MAG: isoleucine--tRNA ligase [Actinomycetia bacterium]|nr:isoleucine--tRNA ligase [Actinomycetes bacterium]MCP4084263.1 isoleucine--tRNA ligase [Actinomycetes bacterium]